jgi:hypothetical protein
VTLFNLPPLEPGYLSTEAPPSADRRRTIRNQGLIARGVHPATGEPLLDPGWGLHCGDCAHAVHLRAGNRAFWKCEWHRLGLSASAASDIRVGWPACTLVRIDAER